MVDPASHLPEEVRFVLANAPAALCYIDANQRYRYANPQFLAWARRTSEQTIGERVEVVLGHDLYRRLEPTIMRTLAGHRSTYEMRARGPNRQVRWLRGVLVPDVKDGDVRGYALMVQDVTRRRVAEIELSREREAYEQKLEAEVRARTEELRVLQHRLLQAERLSTAEEMTGAVAHAINNPLLALLGTAQMATSGMLDPEVALRRVHKLALRIEGVVEGTLRLYQRGEMDLRAESCAEITALLIREIGPRAQGANVHVATKVEDDLPQILADRALLTAALVSVVENALQASPVGSRVDIEVEEVPHAKVVRFVISDSGPGIPEDLRPRVTEPFFTTKPGGTGLGLSIAAGVIQGHNGLLRVTDNPSGGARVSLEFPSAG